MLRQDDARRLPRGQHLVHAAGAQALQIKCHVRVAAGIQGGDNLGAMGQYFIEAGFRHFDTGHITMMAHPQLVEPQKVEGGLRPLNLAEQFRRDGGAIRNARGKAGGGGLVPVAEAQIPGGIADVGLAETQVMQRALDAARPGRTSRVSSTFMPSSTRSNPWSSA